MDKIKSVFSGSEELRLCFATDIHGSETCWRTFLDSGKHYEADVMVLAGHMKDKAPVPLVEQGSGHWHATLLENRRDFENEEGVAEFEDKVKRRGYYPFRIDPDEMSELESDDELRDKRFQEEMLGTIERWMRMANERLPEGMECFVSPGKDDQFEVDEIISAAERVRLAEGEVVEFGEFQMVSTGGSNCTPWDTFREEDKDVPGARLQKMPSRVTAPPERTIYNFHCPPYGSGLDDAPELTESLRPKDAGRSIVPVGSKAVRESIEDQPILALHGHVHASGARCASTPVAPTSRDSCSARW
jgi:uncharacterized protein